VAASRAHLVQFDGGFAIFHTSQGTQEVWKIAKKPNHLAKFGCGSGNILKYFFFSENRISFFKNLPKLQKKNSGHEKIKKLLPGTYILIYVLWNQ